MPEMDIIKLDTRELLKTADINGKSYNIRSDYRVALDVLEMLNDQELTGEERAWCLLEMLYEQPDAIPVQDKQTAVLWALAFLSGGTYDPSSTARPPRLMDWQQDWPLIVAPVSRVAGHDIRSIEYLHWWSFLSMYQEIGDCTFAQVVRIRQLRSKGKKLDKFDQDYYKEHRDLIDLKQTYTDAEQQLLSAWMV